MPAYLLTTFYQLSDEFLTIYGRFCHSFGNNRCQVPDNLCKSSSQAGHRSKVAEATRDP